MSLRLPLLCLVIITFNEATQSIADDEKPQNAVSTTRPEIESLIKQYVESQQKFEDALSKSKAREERAKVRETLQPKPVPNATRFIDWAEANSTDELAAEILVLIVVHGGKTKSATRAFDLLAKDHLDLDGELFLKAAMAAFDKLSPIEAETWALIFAENGSSRQTQALAYLLLAKFKAGLVRYSQLLSNPQIKEEMEKTTDKELLKHIQKLDVDKTNAEAELLFERLITKFPDVKSRGVNIADAAKPDYFSVSKLAIGKTAPEIDGKDLDGKRMVLSAYRGKVVVLCFWGTWCEPCMRMVPHHKELVATHKDDPFAFLGVATDQDRKTLDATIESQGITWRNWWDGGETDHPISKKWFINQWPTILVLDHKGTIRRKHLVGKELDEAVADLLKGITKSKSQ